MSGMDPEKTGGGTSGRDTGSASGTPHVSSNTMRYTSRHGTVVIRATVEHIGVVGDTEMTIQVKWPASSFCAPCSEEKSSEKKTSDTTGVPETGPGAYILHATAPPCGTTTEKREEGKAGASSGGPIYPDQREPQKETPR